MRTLCQNCGLVLTNEKGERKRSAVFSGELPVRPPQHDVTWARCAPCWNVGMDQFYARDIGTRS